MPELPEMEHYKRNLNQLIQGKVITNVNINREKSINIDPQIFIQEVQGNTVSLVQRRAKHLLFRLSNGKVLLLHLMLGGWMFYSEEKDKPDRTVQIQLSFGNMSLYFIGLRLGYLHLYSDQEAEVELADLGPEPLELSFTRERFLAYTEKKRGTLKLKLVDQHFLSGIGNCYSDEICYHAKLLPDRKLEDLTLEEKTALYTAMRTVLPEATEIGGYMEHPLFVNDRKTGSYNNLCRVYDCEGQACQRCGTKIVKIEISSKKTFYCPNCQH